MCLSYRSGPCLFVAYVADWKVQLEKGAPHEVKDHSVEVSLDYCI